MSITHTFTFGHAGGSISLSDSVAVTGEIAAEANISVAASTTDQEEAVAFDDGDLQGIYIKSDVAVTIETNSGSAADDTLAIAAGNPFVWYAGSGITNPFSAAVTSIFITNATGGAATIYIRTLVA